ncbi:MAG TPA: chromosome segregation protein SMC [Ktedonobacterales bacterium]|nr:chromosome segregation protein SMC [Ktedonobacterales bacterium]
MASPVYLKRLELQGFKSFAPRTTLEFSPGVTAIVGPNGSGKSNLADAIRWVLGEQSMRQLRGKKSDDVIFAGGQGRAPMQMAQVGLTLDNSSGWLPTEFSEVSIARRSFRSGESEYLSNGQRTRLKDVLLLLSQARIGHDSYTVVGQGMVDQALSLRADERRALFEDAAGIRGFQAQRNEAEQKLTLTQTNIGRLRDIIGEIEPRLGPLAEQARRAREYSGARDELTRLLRGWYRRQWADSQRARSTAEEAERGFGGRIQELQASLAQEEVATRQAREEREALIAEIGVVRRERGEASGRLQTTERDLAVGRERVASLERQQADLDSEQEQQNEAIEVARAHVGALEAQTAQADERAAAAAAEVDKLESGQHTARQEQEQAEAKLRAAQREVIQAQARLGAAQTELGRLQKQLGERNKALATRREAVTLARRKLDAANAQSEQRRAAFDDAHRKVETLAAERETLAREIADGQAEVERLRAAVADAERERKALADRLALLEEWRRNLDGFGDGPQALLRAAPDERPPILGVVAQVITVTPGLEAAIEAALGPFLQAVAVASPADARQAAAWLRAGKAGRAIFLWSAPAASQPSTPDTRVDGQEVIALASDAISAPPQALGALRRLLADTLIVRDLAAAERIAAQSNGRAAPLTCVTLAGEVVSPRGWMRGGASASASASGAEAGTLGRERELRTLPVEIERISLDIEDTRAQLAVAADALAQRRAREERLKKEAQAAESRAQELARAVTAAQREQERAESELHLAETVAEQISAEVQGIEQEISATAERVAEQEDAQRETTERVEDAQADVDEIAARNRGQLDDLNRARTTLALHKQEATTLAQRAEQIRTQLREIEAQVSRRGERLAALLAQREQLQISAGEQEASIQVLREQVRSLGEVLRRHDERQAELERQIGSLERGQSAERQELARLEVEYRRAIVDAQRARDAIEALAQQIRDELGAESDDDPLPAIIGQSEEAENDAPELSPEELGRMRRQIDSLRSRLKHLGGYDPEAPQQYEELKTRYDFLTGQIRDLTDASTNLRQIITELDATMRRQFVETFHAVNERFQRHFTTLFSGGAARLELTAPRREQSDDDDEEAAAPEEPAIPRKTSFGGVEVYVQIPGKRVQDLSLLSGGERAMVSAALLFALLETNPPPFCMLDEVDAALDEANVVRFCDILKQLAASTQFIVITHNRVTMTNADAIYGVSMGADSVSRVLSMRLAEVPLAR